MPEHETPRHPRHVQDDVNAKGVVITGGALLAIVVVAMLVCWALLDFFGRSAQERQPPLYSWASGDAEKPPEFPRLEGVERQQDRQASRPLYYREMQTLNSYGWVNDSEGVAHIPIERAMQIIVEREQKKQ